MGKMVRIKSHFCGTSPLDNDTGETITLLTLISDQNKRIVPGIYFGEVIELRDHYPVRYDTSRSGLFFGRYSHEDTDPEEVYRTNLHEKTISVGEYFTVTLIDGAEYIYVVDHVVDMNSLTGA